MTTYQVTARRWQHGWELHIDGEGVTQTPSLTTAEDQVRAFLATAHEGRTFDDADISIVEDPSLIR
ncbi:hypothetical protein [Nocardioides sp. BYT-33-1]|uniref:hypothetical protein n=1 Tax=Nocardioides sp. BYT-33-1 TaxID=3416952 RepID=UPI003F52CCF0